jgi:RNA polymerase sigma factor (sigma-70 family)
MKKVCISSLEGFEEFTKYCKFLNCNEEYPGWTGEEKYIIISDMSEMEIRTRFGQIAEALSPFICMSRKCGEAVTGFATNIRKAQRHGSVTVDIDCTDDFENLYESLQVSDFTADYWDRQIVCDAISHLSEVQQRRIRMRYFDDMKLSDIAEHEGVSVEAVSLSIDSAIEKMKKILR